MQSSKFELSLKMQQPQQIMSHVQPLRQLLSKTGFTKTSILEERQQKKTQPLQFTKTQVEVIQFDVKNCYKMFFFEREKYLYCIFGCKDENVVSDKSDLVVWEFKKKNGQNRKLVINGVKGVVTQLKVDFLNVKNPKGQAESMIEQKSESRFYMILGTEDGYVKRIQLSQDYKIASQKLSASRVVKIIPFESQTSSQYTFSFILFFNNQIQLINMLNFDTIYKLFAPIMHFSAQQALSISRSIINPNFLYQATTGGYLIVWEMNEQILKRKMDLSLKNQFKSAGIVSNVSPKYISHELTLNGFSWMDLIGSLIMIIDKMCVLRLYSINFQQQMDFIELFSIQLPYRPQHLSNSIPNLQQNQPQQKLQSFLSNQQIGFQNFIFLQDQLTLYYMLYPKKHTICRLKLNQFMDFEQLQRLKIKNKIFKSIDQFVVSQNERFVIVRNQSGFGIKYFEQGEKYQSKSRKDRHKKVKVNEEEIDY